MSTHLDVLDNLLAVPEFVETETRLRPQSAEPSTAEGFQREQLRNLVRHVFFPGWPRPARQVVLSTIDERADTASTALDIGKAMAAEIPGNVAVIESCPGSIIQFRNSGGTPGQTGPDQQPFVFRGSSRQLWSNLWLVPCKTFVGEEEALSASWLRGRLSELRMEFDYVLINAPPVNRSSEAALLGSLTDGVILTITANRTHRIAAHMSKTILRQANARLLGTILCERIFPIPERLYRKL